MRTSTAFLSLAFLTILGCGAHSLEDLLNAGSSNSEAISSSPSSSSLSSSSSGNGGGSGSLTYQGKTYRTVVIGTQTWMAENLNYDVSGSKCYDNKTENCQKYGRLYRWSKAMTVCPSGWHLPSNAEWDKLMHYVDGTSGTESPYYSETAGRYLKATSGWNSNGNGQDTYGFSALPGGFGYSSIDFDDVGNQSDSGDLFNDVGSNGHWWSSSESGVISIAYGRCMYYNYERVLWGGSDKSYSYSVRCLQD